MSDIAETLNKAANLIEECGWWRGRRVNESPQDYKQLFADTTVCAGLAIRRLSDNREAAVKFAEFLDLGVNTHSGSLLAIYDWNDSQPNGQVVIDKLREVAKELV